MSLFRGLSGRLLMFTIVVVMLVEVAIFLPSVARFRVAYLEERLERAYIASLVVLAAPNDMVTEEMERSLLAGAEVLNVVAYQDGRHVLILTVDRMPMLEGSFDLADASPLSLIGDALRRIATPGGDNVAIRVRGVPKTGEGMPLEIALDPRPLRAAMIEYGWRIFNLSLIISLITAALVFIVMRMLVVRPLARLTDNLKSFQEHPEDPDRVLRPSPGTSELAEAERALAEMQETVRKSLQERARLASLGEAVAKISHDLRNMLASMQLIVDRLEMSKDPMVARIMPKFIAALDRAINLCQRTLRHGRAEEAPPEIRRVRVSRLAEEVAEGLGLGPDTQPVQCRIEAPEDHVVLADREQLYRVLANLVRNASEAIAATGEPGTIRIGGRRAGAEDVLTVSDTGPGLPARTVEHLFQPFRGTGRKGGTGLGLVIAWELIAAHGGSLTLHSTTPEGTVFEIRLPADAHAIGPHQVTEA